MNLSAWLLMIDEPSGHLALSREYPPPDPEDLICLFAIAKTFSFVIVLAYLDNRAST